MTKRRGWILITLGLLLAIGAGALVFVVLQQQQQAANERARLLAQESNSVPMTKIPVAKHALEPGVVLSSADYVLKDFPQDLVPPSALTQTISIDNKVLVQAIGPGEWFRSNLFLGSSGATISQQISQGNVLFAFPIVDLLSQSNLIQDGDHIDLFLTLTATEEESQAAKIKSTALTMQNIEVMKVLRPPAKDKQEQPPATALLLSLKPEDAVMIKFIKDSGGTIDFTLRSPLDKEEFNAPSVNIVDLITRYGFR